MKKSCSSCKQKGVNLKQLGLLLMSLYILFSSIYGTIKLLELF
jgi:hypothetical protein